MSSSKINIAILMSTYNGEKYLVELLDSLINQSLVDFELYISDDGSVDKTCSIITQYTKTYENIHFVQLGHAKQGAFFSFMNLLDFVDADYYLFADQDDVWLNEKVKTLVERLTSLEKRFGDVPILVHSDLKVVDVNLDLISDSFSEYSKINQDLFNKSKYFYAVTNSVVGCTMGINKFVKKLCFPINVYSQMHDSWITVSTVLNGGIINYIPEKLVLYRQHQDNVIGAKMSSGFRYYFLKVFNLKELIDSNKTKYLLARSLDSNFNFMMYIYYKIYYLIRR